MAKTFKIGNSGLPLIPDGNYVATFTGWDLKMMQFGESAQLNFTLNDEKYEGTVVSALAKANITPNTKLGGFVAGLMGEALIVDTEIDLDAFLGTKGIAAVKTVQGKKGDYSVVAEFKKG